MPDRFHQQVNDPPPQGERRTPADAEDGEPTYRHLSKRYVENIFQGGGVRARGAGGLASTFLSGSSERLHGAVTRFEDGEYYHSRFPCTA